MRQKNCIAFIFARGGSKGVPRKNIKILNGKPLITYSIQAALDSPSINRIIVSTDDEEIAAVAKENGAEVPFIRPKELAQDTSAEWYAWRHAVEFLNRQGVSFDIFVSLPATSPFRKVEDVEKCIAKLSDDTDVVITVKKADRSPYFNMVTKGSEGYCQLAIKPDTSVARRQDAPIVYDMTTVAYVTRPSFIIDNFGIFSGRVKSVLIPSARAIDIDTPIDFKLAELLASEMGGSNA